MHPMIHNACRCVAAAGLALGCVAAMRPVQAYSSLRALCLDTACDCGLEAACEARESRLKPGFDPAPCSPIQTGPMPGRPAIGDVNNDGKHDIAVACGTCCGSQPDARSGHVLVFLGDGRGGFRPAGERIIVGPSALKVAIGDANGDRNADLFVIEHNTDNLTVLLGDGTGAFSAAPGSPFSHGHAQRPHTHDVAVADVNGDGRLDALATRCNDNRIAVMLGDGAGGFAPGPGSPLPAGRHPYEGLTVRDVTADGKADVIVANLQGDTISVLAGDGRGAFAQSPGSPFAAGPRPGTLVVADLNADGRDDIAATHDDEALLAVLLADGHGGFAPAKDSPLTLGQRIWGVAAADFDGDGNMDLAGAQWDGAALLFRGNSTGGVTGESIRLPAGSGSGQLAVADLNGDGRPDIVTGNYQSGDLTVLLAK